VPRYFTPKIINNQKLADGGLSSNNPSLLAWQEARRIAPGFKRPDQFVSIGTGVTNASNVDSTNIVSGWYCNNPLYQTGQHYWQENFNGDKQFESMRQVLLASGNGSTELDGWFRRFNLPLEGQLPDLADAGAIDSLAETAWSYFESSYPIQQLALSLIASLFYYELRCRPIFENGHYTCYGRILCRIPMSNPAFPTMMEKLDQAHARFVVHGRTLPTTGSRFSTFNPSKNFSKPVLFHVSSLSDPIEMSLRFVNTQQLPISASPSSIASFVELQRLDWPGSLPARPASCNSRKRFASRVPLAPPKKRICNRNNFS
jgi:hypothetical protein